MEKFNDLSGLLYKLLFVIFCISIGAFIGASFDNPIIGGISGLVLAVVLYIIFKPHVDEANDVASDHTGDYQLQTEVNFLHNIGHVISLAIRAAFSIFVR